MALKVHALKISIQITFAEVMHDDETAFQIALLLYYIYYIYYCAAIKRL